ncbi:MAG: dihydrofolate reductase [Hyphomicrobiaceae bacterium]
MSRSGVTCAAIVARSRDKAIGRDNALPWHLGSDLRRFKVLTMGKPMIMGRRTFASIGRPLPGRASIVLTRDPAFAAAGVMIARSKAEALALGEAEALRMGAEEIMVIGGEEVLHLLADVIGRIYLTEVDTVVGSAADAHFDFDASGWREVSREHVPASSTDDHASTFMVLERLGS